MNETKYMIKFDSAIRIGTFVGTCFGPFDSLENIEEWVHGPWAIPLPSYTIHLLHPVELQNV